MSDTPDTPRRVRDVCMCTHMSKFMCLCGNALGVQSKMVYYYTPPYSCQTWSLTKSRVRLSGQQAWAILLSQSPSEVIGVHGHDELYTCVLGSNFRSSCLQVLLPTESSFQSPYLTLKLPWKMSWIQNRTRWHIAATHEHLQGWRQTLLEKVHALSKLLQHFSFPKMLFFCCF